MKKQDNMPNSAENTAVAPAPKKESRVPLRVLKIFLATVVVVLIGYFGFTCKVQEGNCAVILRFGAPRQVVTDAGLYFIRNRNCIEVGNDLTAHFVKSGKTHMFSGNKFAALL